MTRIILVIALVCSFSLVAAAQSAPKAPEQKPSNTQQTAPADQRGTEQSPAIVKILPTPKTPEEAAQDSKERKEKADGDWALVKLTGALAIVGALQLLVFGYQAWKLRETVQAAAQQSKDMENSIAEAARAAAAMESMAAGIAISAQAAQESVATIRERTAIQMRAYLTVLINQGVYQEREKGLKFEVKPILINTGQTPAHKVTYRATAAVLPFPLPDSFILDPPEHTLRSALVLGPQQNIVMNALVDMVFDDEVAETIKLGRDMRAYIWGTATYSDAFGEPHETNFCHSIYWIMLEDGKFIINGNYAARHNDAT
jgi:hypothetical protein